MADFSTKWKLSTRSGNPVTVLDTSGSSPNTLASVAANAGGITSAAIDNDADLDQFADFALAITFASSPTAGGIIELWLLPTVDGSNFEDGTGGGSAVTPNRQADATVAVRAVNTAQVLVFRRVELPPRDFHVLIVNRTSQTFPATTTTLKMLAYGDWANED